MPTKAMAKETNNRNQFLEKDGISEAFAEVLLRGLGESPPLDPDRLNRLLAYVRLRQSPLLVEVAEALLRQWEGKPEPEEEVPRLQRKGTVMHCLEILLRNGVEYGDLPYVLERDRVWLRELPLDRGLGALERRRRATILVKVVGEGEVGRFMMGSEKGGSDERPVHEVMLSGPLWVGKYAVTNVEYAKYVQSIGSAEPEFWHYLKFNVWDQPVVGVSWEEAKGYGERSGCGLPSEAEWEYACRAGSEGEYSFEGGEEELGKYGWYGGDHETGSTHGVGLLKPNLMGLCDMHGNVLEWCEDVWDVKAYGKRGSGWLARTWLEEDVEDWNGGLYIVLRGGCWIDGSGGCRSAYRYRNDHVYRNRYYGFRVVCREAGPGMGAGGNGR